MGSKILSIVLFLTSLWVTAQDDIVVFNEKYCGPGTVTLSSISGDCSNFKWYDQANGGNLLGSGCSYTDPTATFRQRYFVSNPQITSTDANCANFEWFDSRTSNTPIATGCSFIESSTDVKSVYYYSDPNTLGTSTYGYTDGDLPTESAVYTTPDQAEKYVSVFDAKEDFVLNSISVKVDKSVYAPPGSTFQVELLNNLDQVIDFVTPTNVPTGNGTGTEVFILPLGFNIPQGTDYKLRLSNVYQNRIFVQTGGADYSAGGPLDNLVFHIKSYGQARQWVGGPLQTDYFSGMFDWNVSALGLKQTFYNNRAMVVAEDTCNIICGEDIDLNTWTIGGDALNGEWNVTPDGKAVTQNINGRPTFFISPEDYINVELTGSFTVNDPNDNDFAGFVFGYQAPINDVVTQKYYLFDWKKENQGNGVEGFTLNEVDMVRDMSNINHTQNSTDYWDHIDQPGFSVIERYQGPNTGWERNQKYKFTLVYTSTRATIVMDGGVYSNDTIIDIDGCFEPGRFGFYNFSQENVTYSDFSYKLTADYQLVYPEVCEIDSGTFVAFDSVGGACGGNSLDLATNVVKWDWDFGDGNSGDGSVVRHLYDSSGIYDVLLQVTDSIGCTANVTKQIKVLIKQDVYLDATPDTLCEGENVRIVATPINDSYYEWFKDGVSLGSAQQNDSALVVTETGVYYAQLSGNPDYCDSFTDSVFYLFKELPSISLVDSSSCPRRKKLLYTAPYLSDMVYQWTVSGADSFGLDSNRVLYNIGDTPIDITLKIIDTLGCESPIETAQVLLKSTDVINITPNTAVCESDTNVYSVPDDGGTYVWNVLNARDYDTTNNVVEVVFGDQDVDLVVLKEGGVGCDVKDSIRITVNQLPDIAISGLNELCVDASEVYTTTSTGTLVWNVDNGSFIDNGNSISVSNFSDSLLKISLEVTSTELCKADTAIEVLINPLPVPSFTSPVEVCENSFFNAVLLDTFDVVTWTVNGAAGYQDMTDSILVEASNSNLQVSVSVIDTNNCSADSSRAVAVNLNPQTEIDNPTVQVCEGDTVIYQPIVSLGSSYTWSVDTATFIQQANSVEVVFDGTSATWVYLNEVDSKTCEGKDSVLVSTVTIAPPMIAGEENPCVNTTEQYTVSGSGGNFTWSIIEGLATSQVSGDNFDFSFSTIDSVVVSVLENLNGCTSRDTFSIMVRPEPSITLSAPLEVCVDKPFDVMALFDDGPKSWNVVGATYTNLSDSIKVLPSANDVSVSLVQTTPYNCVGGDTIEIIKNSLPTPQINNPTLLVCPDDTVSYHVIEQAGSSYSWNVKSEDFTTIFVTVVVLGAKKDFEVVVYEVDSKGCKGGDSINVNLVDISQNIISGKQDVCLDDSTVYLSATNVGATVEWNILSGIASLGTTNGTQTGIKFSQVNTVVVNAKETRNGCSVSDTHEVIVHDAPLLNVSSVSSICLESDPVSIVTSPSSGVLSGVGIQGSVFNPKSSGVNIGGENWLYYNYQDQYGCENADSTSVMVYREPNPQISVLEPVICEGSSTTIYETSVTSGTKKWYKNNVSLSSSDTSINTGIGNYYLTVMQNGCEGKSNTVSVNEEYATVEISGESEVKIGLEQFMTTSYSSDVAKIEWFDSLGNVIGKEFDLLLEANQDACVLVKVSTNVGCIDTDEFCYSVLNPILPMEVFTPNGDGVNETWVIDYITDYPESIVKVYNRFGNIVYQNKGYENDWDGTRNGDLVPTAVYYYVIDLMDGSDPIGGSVTVIY